MARKTYRTGVIGHTGRGDYGHDLDVAAATMPEIQLVAVADPDPEGRARAVARCGASRGYSDYKEMLAKEHLDLVVIATRWVEEHEEMLLAAIRAGAHVYCEKPFVRSLTNADRVLAAADAAGVKVSVAHVSRAFTALNRIRSLVTDGAIGRLRLLRGYGKCDRRGGGQDLFVLGTHILDLMRYFAGDVVWAHAHVTQDGIDVTPRDVRFGDEGIGPIAGNGVVAYYAFNGGVAGEFESLVAEDGSGDSYFSLLLHGTAGTFAIRSQGDRYLYRYRRPVLLPDDGACWDRLVLEGHELEAPADPGERQRWAHRRLIRDLLASIEENHEPRSSGWDARAALEMIMAAYESQRLGRRVTFPLQLRSHPLEVLSTGIGMAHDPLSTAQPDLP